jgi:hypothetical protein
MLFILYFLSDRCTNGSVNCRKSWSVKQGWQKVQGDLYTTSLHCGFTLELGDSYLKMLELKYTILKSVWIFSVCCLMMEAVRTSETSINFYQTTQCNIPEGSHLHTNCHENLKSDLLMDDMLILLKIQYF